MSKIFLEPRQKIYNFSFLEPIKYLFKKKVTERDISTYFQNNFNFKNSLTTSQGRLAIYLAVRSLVNTNKNEIILSPYTVFDIVNMIICAGGKPVFADIDFPSLSISTEEFKRKISNKTAAVILTHYHSNSNNIKDIKKITLKNDIKIIEDCAQVFGTRNKDNYVGLEADIAIFSFNITKFISTLSGGLLICKDDELFKKIKIYSNQFEINPFFYLFKKYLKAVQIKIFTSKIFFNFFTRWIIRITLDFNIKIFKNLVRSDPNPIYKSVLPKVYNTYVSNYQRKDIFIKINKYTNTNQQKVRLDNYLFYQKNLINIKQIKIHEIANNSLNGVVVFPLYYPFRDKLYKYMILNGCDISKYFYRDCSSLEIFNKYNEFCKNSNRACNEVIVLPVYPTYSIDSIEKNISTIKKYFKDNDL